MAATFENNLLSLKNDIKIVGEYFQEISVELRAGKISQYPIFIAHHKNQIELGRPIIDREKTHTNWSFNVSLLEEFVKKSVFDQQKIEEFRSIYKDPAHHACVLLLGDADFQIVFCPYEIADEN